MSLHYLKSVLFSSFVLGLSSQALAQESQDILERYGFFHNYPEENSGNPNDSINATSPATTNRNFGIGFAGGLNSVGAKIQYDAFLRNFDWLHIIQKTELLYLWSQDKIQKESQYNLSFPILFQVPLPSRLTGYVGAGVGMQNWKKEKVEEKTVSHSNGYSLYRVGTQFALSDHVLFSVSMQKNFYLVGKGPLKSHDDGIQKATYRNHETLLGYQFSYFF